MRFSSTDRDDADVPLSPLIDCVFLLLIFFLVTTMLKKWEKQIPVTMPDPTSSLSAEADEDHQVIGLTEDGVPLQPTGEMDEHGVRLYTPIDDLAVFLHDLGDGPGSDVPILISADRETPFQKVIDVLDLAQLQGFDDVAVRTRSRKQ